MTFDLPAVGEYWPAQRRVRCCEEDGGGSHYHCAHCGRVSSYQGHFVSLTRPEQVDAARRRGLPFPFEGFTCDHATNRLEPRERPT